MRTHRHLLSLAAALLLAAPAPAQVSGTTNTLDHVLMTTPMWSLADPFGFADLASATGRVSVLELISQSVTGSVASASASALAAYTVGTNAAFIASAANVNATSALAQAAAVYDTSTNALAQTSASAAAAYVASTNAEAQVGTVYPVATNAAAASALATTRANLAYALAASVNAVSTNALHAATNALHAATNAAAQVATAYPAATNALHAATNAAAQVATAYPAATNAAAVSGAAYAAATNAAWLAAGLALSKADVAALENYATLAEFGVFSAAVIDAVNIAEEALANTAAGAAATNALANLRVARLWDADDTNVFVEVEGGTNVVVYRIMGDAPVTNFFVTLSEDFEETVGHTRPAWTNNVFPFIDGAFVGSFVDDYAVISSQEAEWKNFLTNGFPLNLIPQISGSGQGTATVSIASIVPPTNELFRIEFGVLTNLAARLAAVEASAASASNMAAVLETNTVTRAEAAGWETGSHAGLATTGDVAAAVAAIPQSDPFIVRDTADTNRWWRFEGTQAVQYALGALTTNYTVTYSQDFGCSNQIGESEYTFERPTLTNGFPFTSGDWFGDYTGYIYVSFEGTSVGRWQTLLPVSYPVTLLPAFSLSYGTATVEEHIYYPTNATGNTLGPIPTNLVTDAGLAAWWLETEATKLDAQEFEDHVTPAITPDPHEGVYLLRAYTNAVPVAGNTLLTLDGTNLTVTGETFAYRAFPTNAYRLGISPTAPAFHYGGTIIGTNAVTFATNLLLRGTATVSGTNCFALQYWSNGVWEVLWGAK